MRTELEIIYTVWSIVRGGEFNADDPINERLMRRFLQIHRGKLLTRLYEKGATVPDEVFQSLGRINFSLKNGEYISPAMPKTIRLENYGFFVDFDGFPISVVNQEEWLTSKKDRFNKYFPLVKLVNNKMTLSNGMKKTGVLEDLSNSFLNQTVEKLGKNFFNDNVGLNVQAVLVNPDDEPGYDFTKSPYPMPDELIEDLINSVNAREFNLFIRMRSDETGDSRDDTKPKDNPQEY
jgi:hypothetical protein